MEITKEMRQVWSRKGGLARAAQFTSESQRHARSHVKRESLQRAGANGYKAFAAKNGPEAAARRFANWRREHPSVLESIVRQWMDDLNVFYVSEAVLDGFTIYPDFLILNGLVVECDGAGWHAMRAEYDHWRDELLRKAGYTVLRLSEKSIRDGSAFDILAKHLEAVA